MARGTAGEVRHDRYEEEEVGGRREKYAVRIEAGRCSAVSRARGAEINVLVLIIVVTTVVTFRCLFSTLVVGFSHS